MRFVRALVFMALIAAGASLMVDNSKVESLMPIESAPAIVTTLHQAVGMLAVVPEDRHPYERSLFGAGWADLDGDCQDTRAEVLARESLAPIAKGCTVFRGKWISYYDNEIWTRSFEVQIDHLVPLAEAWDSGAYRWNAEARLHYANDVGDRRALVPTTTALNYAKLADDPSRFIPAINACRYILSWVAVKLRWNLTVDQREYEAITIVAKSCPNTKIVVRKANQ
ncbi:MAG: HNH endonuclease [Kineosporiaceae bacterium]|nr:HNH endonuclease [Aeromicrobium sp.]